jgi:hypothetical protein
MKRSHQPFPSCLLIYACFGCEDMDVRRHPGDSDVFSRGARVSKVHSLLVPGRDEPHSQPQQCTSGRSLARPVEGLLL